MKKVAFALAFTAIILMIPVIVRTNSLNAVYEDNMAVAQEVYIAPVRHAVADALKIEKLVNDYRAANGLNALTHNDLLCKSSKAKVDDMVANKYFAHDSPDGKKGLSYIRDYGSFSGINGENLALSSKSGVVDSTIVSSWIASEGHRNNMVSDFTDTCVSVAETYDNQSGGLHIDRGVVVVQHFAHL